MKNIKIIILSLIVSTCLQAMERDENEIADVDLQAVDKDNDEIEDAEFELININSTEEMQEARPVSLSFISRINWLKKFKDRNYNDNSDCVLPIEILELILSCVPHASEAKTKWCINRKAKTNGEIILDLMLVNSTFNMFMNNPKMLTRFLGVSVKYTPEKAIPVFINAIENCKDGMVNAFLGSGVLEIIVKHTPEKAIPVFIRAIESCKDESVNAFLESGIFGMIVNTPEKVISVFVKAIENSRNVVVNAFLMSADVDVNSADTTGLNPLMAAILFRNCDYIGFLIRKGANVNECLKKECETEFLIISENDARKKAPIKFIAGTTPLMMALRIGFTKAAEILINAHANIDAKNINGNTALILSVGCAYHRVIKMLIENGADVDLANNEGLTALMSASLRGFVFATSMLIDANAKIDAKNINGDTALIFAIKKGYSGVAEMLLKNSDYVVNLANNQGLTALMSASSKGLISIVRMLITYGATINTQDESGNTALIYSARHGSLEVAKKLLKKGANVKLANKKKHTPLIEAYKCIKCSKHVFEFLIKHDPSLIYPLLNFVRAEEKALLANASK